VGGRRRRAELRQTTSADRSHNYLELAREIDAEVQRLAADPNADLDVFARALDSWPAEQRVEAVVQAFRALPRDERWSILADLFDDDELRAALAGEHQQAAAEVARRGRHQALAAAVRSRRALDVRDLAVGDELTLDLFRSVDVRNALVRGRASTSCARRLVLRATGEDGGVSVVDDVFNPEHGLFVTADYDESVWRAERLEPNARVRVGTFGGDFEPVIIPGSCVDVELDAGVRRGRLHAGAATVGGISMFSEDPS
jgi:hypothetical protein